MRSHKSFSIIAAAVLAVVCLSAVNVRAAIFTSTVEFVASPDGSQNQFTIAGQLNTLSQALGVVDFGNTSVSVSGLLRAQLTLETSEQGDIQILGFELLDSDFTQTGVNLFYDVPNTTRQVTFSTAGLQFGLQFTGQSNSNQQLLSTGINIPPDTYQMVQSAGTAQVGITNRPSVEQDLSQQSVLSTYLGGQPVGQAAFTILSSPAGPWNSLIELNLPFSQQIHYANVGLPVTLNYAGTLNLVAPLTIAQVPEPGTLALLGAASCLVLGRRRRTVLP